MLFKKTCFFILMMFLLGSCTKQSPAKNIHLKVNPIFGDSAVLQRDSKVRVFGFAKKNTKVRVILKKWILPIASAESLVNDDGKWIVQLDAQRAGGPFELEIINENEAIKLRDIYFGDVWLAVGQSNMDQKVQGSNNSIENFVKAEKYPRLRFFRIMAEPNPEEQDTYKPVNKWLISNTANCKDFSALAFSFARKYYDKEKIPVGIIQATWDATKIEFWMSEDSLKNIPEFKNVFEQKRDYKKYSFITNLSLPSEFAGKAAEIKLAPEIGELLNAAFWINDYRLTNKPGSNIYLVPEQIIKTHGNELRVRISEKEIGFATSKRVIDEIDKTQLLISLNPGEAPKMGVINKWKKLNFIDETQPAVLFNAFIAPLVPYNFKAVLWYQGESDVFDLSTYRSKFINLVNDWRSRFLDLHLPFITIQLPSYVWNYPNGALPRFRTIQESIANDTDGVSMLSIIEVGEADGAVHYANKDYVGERLAEFVFELEKNPQLKFMQPRVKNLSLVDSTKLLLKLDPGLAKDLLYRTDQNQALSGFEISGADKHYLPARVSATADEVVLTSDYVSKPLCVRYAWKDMPELSVKNDRDYFLSSFESCLR